MTTDDLVPSTTKDLPIRSPRPVKEVREVKTKDGSVFE